MNIFQRFLISKAFPFVAGGIVMLLLTLTYFAYFAQKQTTQDGQGLGGLISFTNLFGSANIEEITVDESVKEQINVSVEVASWEKKVAGRYPWRRKLPLATDKYFVYFDLTRKIFIGRIYPDNDDLIEQIKAEVIRVLKKEKGVPLEEFTLDWDVYPKSTY